MTLITPFDLLRTISPALEEKEAIPLTGKAPSFPWNTLSEKIGTFFEREKFLINPGKLSWKSAEEIYNDLGIGYTTFSLSFSNIEGQAFWVLPKNSIEELSLWFLEGKHQNLEIDDKKILHQFYDFFALEVLHQASSYFSDEQLVPQLSKSDALIKEKALCRDISLHFGEKTIFGRILLPENFRLSWVRYFANQASTEIENKLKKHNNIELVVSGGETYLSYEEWLSVKEGDCLLIDESSLSLPSLQGNVDLLFEQKIVFHGKIEKDNLKILELSSVQKVESKMEKNPKDHEEEESDFTDFDLTEEEEFETFDEDFLNDETSEFSDTEQNATKDETAETDVEDFEETKEESNDFELKKEEKALSNTIQKEVKEDNNPISPNKIPLTLTIEIARIKMPIENFLQLEPGNLIKLQKKPQDSVNLSINGEIVAKGELIMIGEALGVRIEEVGS